jgi:hypothetical protein
MMQKVTSRAGTPENKTGKAPARGSRTAGMNLRAGDVTQW